MDFMECVTKDYIEDFARSRMESAGHYRAGDSSIAVRVVGAAAAAVERASATVRRWAREPGDGNVAPQRSALVRH